MTRLTPSSNDTFGDLVGNGCVQGSEGGSQDVGFLSLSHLTILAESIRGSVTKVLRFE